MYFDHRVILLHILRNQDKFKSRIFSIEFVVSEGKFGNFIFWLVIDLLFKKSLWNIFYSKLRLLLNDLLKRKNVRWRAKARYIYCFLSLVLLLLLVRGIMKVYHDGIKNHPSKFLIVFSNSFCLLEKQTSTL